MTAPRWHGRGDIRLGDVPGPTELLVKVTWYGICGSGLEEWQTLNPPPMTAEEEDT